MPDPTPDDPRRTRFLANPTRAYAPAGAGWWGYGVAGLDGAPWFTWLDVPRMLRDPRVRLAERMWRAPFRRVTHAVAAEDPRVKKFVAQMYRRFWTRSLPRLLSRYFRFGFAPGGAEFEVRKGLVRLTRVTAVEPRDARPRVWAAGTGRGSFAGFELAAGGAAVAAAGGTWVGPPHAVWFAGNQEFGPLYDLAPLSGAFEPWAEKRTRGGAVSSRRLWFRKAAWRGGKLYHPPGRSNVGTEESPQERDNQDLARELLEYAEAGAVYTFTNEVNPAEPGKYAWDFTEAAANPDVKGIREYPQDLDKEILEGVGIPPEVLDAAEVGSGWSGRMVPLLGFLGGVDEYAGLATEAFDPVVRHAVDVNFGRQTWYEAEPNSLVDQLQDQAKDKDGDKGNPIAGLLGMQQPPPPVSKPVSMSDGRSGVSPDVADRVRKLGRLRKRDLIGLVVVAMLKAQERATAAGKPRAAGPYLDQLAAIAGDPDRLSEVTGAARAMSWTPYEGKRGGRGWKNTETGRIVYGEHKPGERRARATASGERAREILTKVGRAEATPDDLAELADHLPALPVARLRNARAILGASWGGSARRREEMVGRLLEHVRARVERERAGAKPPAAKPRPKPRPAKPAPRPAPSPPPPPPPPTGPTTPAPASDAEFHAAVDRALAADGVTVGNLMSRPPGAIPEFARRHGLDDRRAFDRLMDLFVGRAEPAPGAAPGGPDDLPPGVTRDAADRIDQALDRAGTSAAHIGGVNTDEDLRATAQSWVRFTGVDADTFAAYVRHRAAYSPEAPPATAARPPAGSTSHALPSGGTAHVTGRATAEQLRRHFGRDVDPGVLAAAANAAADSHVEVDKRPDGTVHVETGKPGSYSASRTFARGPDGKLYVKNHTFFMAFTKRPGTPGTNRGDWVKTDPDLPDGIDMFSRQVDALTALGVSKIKTHAARSDPTAYSSGMNGYYTWPRFGYDADLKDAGYFDALPDHLKRQVLANPVGSKHRHSVLSLMATKEGREWWQEHGSDLHRAEFDLTPGSPSMRALEAYKAERERERAAKRRTG